MSTPTNDQRIDYIELPATDVSTAKAFYAAVFGWEFVDYGPKYTSFRDGRLEGGLNGDRPVPAEVGSGTLVVIYAEDIDATADRVLAAGGRISLAVFEFPGGRRFHFVDPSGNELAVWTIPAKAE